MKDFIAEGIGTFFIVLCGTGSIIIHQQIYPIHAIGIAAIFGVTVATMIYVFGKTSGGHFNPAVTVAFAYAGLFNGKKVFSYITAQITGAFIATIFLQFLFPTNHSLGATLSTLPSIQTFTLEFMLTLLLMLTILCTSQSTKIIKPFAGLAIGSIVFLGAFFVGPLTGASMNPARSISPAWVSGNTSGLWIYLLAPVSGAITASFIWKKLMSHIVTA